MEELVLKFTGEETSMDSPYMESYLISVGNHELWNTSQNKMKTSDTINAGKNMKDPFLDRNYSVSYMTENTFVFD